MAAEVLEFAPLVGEVPEYEYPESDGEPMGDNDTQIELMILLRQALRRLFDGQQVYISANVFWYPVHGKPGIRTAPDLIVAFGRPPGNRGSYREWDEDGVAPQVVAEVVSPSNSPAHLAEKLSWYDRFGVEEYWVLDPAELTDAPQVGWYRRQASGRLVQQRWDQAVRSPRLGIGFRLVDRAIMPYGPDGRPLKDDLTLAKEADAATVQAQEATVQAQEATARAEAAEAELAALRAQMPAPPSGS